MYSKVEAMRLCISVYKDGTTFYDNQHALKLRSGAFGRKHVFLRVLFFKIISSKISDLSNPARLLQIKIF